MKKNGEYVGVDEKFIPEDEKYVDESLLGDKEESKRKVKKFAKTIAIGYILFITLVFSILVITGVLMFKYFNKTANGMINSFNQKSSEMADDYNNKLDNMKDKYNSESEKFDKLSFNASLQTMQGTQSKFMLSNYLDEIISKNKTNGKHTITVTYKEIVATDEAHILEIKQLLNEDNKYEASLDYDSNGYINKVTITEQ